MGVNGMYGLYGVDVAPVRGPWSKSHRGGRYVVFVTGDGAVAEGEAERKARRGRVEVVEVADLAGLIDGAGRLVGWCEDPRCGAGQGNGRGLSSFEYGSPASAESSSIKVTPVSGGSGMDGRLVCGFGECMGGGGGAGRSP